MRVKIDLLMGDASPFSTLEGATSLQQLNFRVSSGCEQQVERYRSSVVSKMLSFLTINQLPARLKGSVNQVGPYQSLFGQSDGEETKGDSAANKTMSLILLFRPPSP